MPAPRPRSAQTSRQLILAAARAEFAQAGYEKATVRAIAAAAGVDPALVIRYFENKAGLFAQASRFELDLPDLGGLTPAEMADALVGRFFQVWEEDGAFVALLRAAASSETAAQTMAGIFHEQAAPVLMAAALDQPERRAALAGSQVIGFAFARYVLRVPPVAGLGRDEVRALLGPAIVHHLTAPLETPEQSRAGSAGPRPQPGPAGARPH